MTETPSNYSISDLTLYLDQYFFTETQILQKANTTKADLEAFQTNQVMPLASYCVAHSICCNSFFGNYQVVEKTNYYAKGYLDWLNQLIENDSSDQAFVMFAQTYRNTIETVQAQGLVSLSNKFDLKSDEYLRREWQHFLSGTYGLCTKSGLPEDIAKKELATLVIEELMIESCLDANQLALLTFAVKSLDQASALFAPHERKQSSRARLVDRPRKKYRL